MLRATIIFLLVFVSSAFANTLRVSEVTTSDDANAEQMTLTTENGKETHWVKKHALISDKDIIAAFPVSSSEHSLAVKLNETAAERLLAKTKSMNHGKDKLATVIDGKLEEVYVLQSILHEHVSLYLPERDIYELQNLGLKIMGQPPRPKREIPDLPKPRKVETRPFTEEEYQQRKTSRESFGIFYIEKAPTSEEIDQLLDKKTSLQEVIKQLGPPTFSFDPSEPNNLHLFYEIAPEKLPQNPTGKQIIDGFNLEFRKGKLSFWSYRYSTKRQLMKVLRRMEPTLVATIPPIDMGGNDFTPVALLESIIIPQPDQQVNIRDLQDLVSLTMSLSTKLPDAPKVDYINTECDFVKTLACNFPEVQEIILTAVNKQLPIDKLVEHIAPYARGIKDTSFSN